MKKQKVKIIEVHMQRRIPLETKTCLQCKRRFEGTKRARYCSVACANKASYYRHAEERRKRRMERYRANKTEQAGQTHRAEQGK